MQTRRNERNERKKGEEDFLCPRPLTHHRLFWLSHPFIHIHRSSSCLIWSSAPSAGHERNKKNLKPTPSASYFLHFPIQRQQRLALDDWNFLFLLVRQNWIEKGKKKRHTHTQVCKFVFNCVCAGLMVVEWRDPRPGGVSVHITTTTSDIYTKEEGKKNLVFFPVMFLLSFFLLHSQWNALTFATTTTTAVTWLNPI